MNNSSEVIVKMSNILHNYQKVENYSGKTILQIVKSNAYNLGSIKISHLLQAHGCQWFCVENIDAAKKLRQSGITGNILVLNNIDDNDLPIAIKNNISITVYDMGKILSYNSLARGQKLKCHLSVDTGMHRLGVMPNEIITVKKRKPKIEKYSRNNHAVQLAKLLNESRNLIYEGTWSHFQRSEDTDTYDDKYNIYQIDIFNNFIKDVKSMGINPGFVHMANSYGIVNYLEEMNYTQGVRPGLFVLLGLGPSEENKLNLRRTFEWKTKVINVKTYPKNTPISYNGLYVTPERQTIAIMPIGYSDGFRRLLDNKTEVLVGGQRCRIAGRVTMNFTMLIVADQTKVGDEVVLIGKQGNDEIDVSEVATWWGTNVYDVAVNIDMSIPRKYI